MSAPHLPEVLVEIEEAIGPGPTAILVAARGGTEFFVPSRKSLKASHWLVELLGEDAAQRLSDHFEIHRPLLSKDDHGRGSGARVQLPLARALRRQYARQVVRDMSLNHKSLNQIALTLGVTTRQVSIFRKELRTLGEL
jgi:hypothetical protein